MEPQPHHHARHRSRPDPGGGAAIGLIILLALIVLGVGVALWGVGLGRGRSGPQAAAVAVSHGPVGIDTVYEHGELTFVGADRCARCHEAEHTLWQGSHHDLAMDHATPDTVRGDFNSASVTQHGVTTTFTRPGGRFVVRTEGDDGELHDFEVLFVFGAQPLQQYLVETGGGRLQVLPWCWDTRPAEAGGQRWFHLYGQERIAPGDELFWTGLNQNWNTMCAECHSTNLKKGYDPDTRTFATTFAEIDVSCEACHGPGSAHLDWAEAWERAQRRGEATGEPDPADMGLAVRLDNGGGGAWRINPDTGQPERTVPLTSRVQLDNCARCHARRSELVPHHRFGGAFDDGFRVVPLEEGLYHADGQVLDEVYVYGSFLQSRMYHKGVRCVDCHEPHSLNLRYTGNGVCTQCHEAPRYNTPAHHFHDPAVNTAGTRCVDCHMPERTYMQVDDRRDHSFRVPRPDWSVALGTPNACTDCHTEQGFAWAADQVRAWYGEPAGGAGEAAGAGAGGEATQGQGAGGESAEQNLPGAGAWGGSLRFAGALHAGRVGSADAEALLVELAGRADQPAIARATGLDLLGGLLSAGSLPAVRGALADPSPLVRAAAVRALASAPPELRWELASDRLRDPVRLVRIDAARVLASAVARGAARDPADRAAFDAAVSEFLTEQRTSAERPESWANLGGLHADLGRVADAEAAYRRALELGPGFVPAAVNLADLYRRLGRDPEAAAVLREVIEHRPAAAPAHHALGLTLVRLGQSDAALGTLGRAAELDPGAVRYGYVYAIALHSAGRSGAALDRLATLLEAHPARADLLSAAATIARDAGDLPTARRHARQLLEHHPTDPAAQALWRSLGGNTQHGSPAPAMP